MHSLYYPGLDLQFAVIKVAPRDEGECIPVICLRVSPENPKALLSVSFGDPNFIR